ncbi:MAG: DUF4130 domain-containing protein [Bacillota bacterium]|nr:hypothetical protein [Bacillota bacterium]
MILYSPRIKSVLAAALLAGIHGETAVAKTAAPPEGLFADQCSHDADHEHLNKIVPLYETTFATTLGWLEEAPGLQLKRLIQLNLRHNPPDFPLILQAVSEALRHGPQYCLQCVSPAARKFTNRANAVQREVHRMLGFIRFVPKDEQTLVAKPLLFHHTADLILRRFQGRYPAHKLVLILDNCAVSLFHQQLSKEPAAPYLPYIKDPAAEELWRRYYQSQYINSRKNIPLARQHIPQKYWDWLNEGQMLKTEKDENPE